MPQISIIKQSAITQIFNNFFTKINWAITAFKTPINNSQIQLSNGVILDLDQNRIIIQGDFSLHTEGNLNLSSDKHVIISSGRDPEARPGYIHGVWLNPDKDKNGLPLLDNDVNLIEGETHVCIKHT